MSFIKHHKSQDMKSPVVYNQGCYVLSTFLFVPHKKRIRSHLIELSISLEVHLCSISPQSPIFMTYL